MNFFITICIYCSVDYFLLSQYIALGAILKLRSFNPMKYSGNQIYHQITESSVCGL
jgi:hypothetical protein